MIALLLVAGLALLAACGGAEDPPTPGDITEPPAATTATGPTETDATEDTEEATSCTNEEDGFTVEYPADWHTNDAGVAPTCSFFHPEPFEVPEASEAVGIAIRVDREPVAFGRVTGNVIGRQVHESEDVTVAGRPAARIEYEATGEGLLDAGTRGVDYFVDLGGGETLVASTVDVGEGDFDEHVRVLDEMVPTIALTR